MCSSITGYFLCKLEVVIPQQLSCFKKTCDFLRKYLRSRHALPRDYEVTAGSAVPDMLTLCNQMLE